MDRKEKGQGRESVKVIKKSYKNQSAITGDITHA